MWWKGEALTDAIRQPRYWEESPWSQSWIRVLPEVRVEQTRIDVVRLSIDTSGGSSRFNKREREMVCAVTCIWIMLTQKFVECFKIDPMNSLTNCTYPFEEMLFKYKASIWFDPIIEEIFKIAAWRNAFDPIYSWKSLGKMWNVVPKL